MTTFFKRTFFFMLLPAHLVLAQEHALDQAVLTEMMRGATSPLGVNALQSNPEFLRRYSSGVLEQELAQESARRGLAERLDVQQALANARMQILIQALQADVSRKLPRPTDAEIEAEFSGNPEEYRLLEAVRVDLFVLDGTLEESLAIARQAVATQSIDPEELQKTRFQQVALADQGVWVARDVFPDEVWGQLRHLPEGRVRFFPAGDNYLLLRYFEHREERPATLDEVRDQIRQQLTQRRFQEAWNTFVREKQRSLGLGGE